MGEYKFSVYAKWQLGLSIEYNGQIIIGLPFMDIHFSLSKYAKGIEIFGKYWSQCKFYKIKQGTGIIMNNLEQKQVDLKLTELVQQAKNVIDEKQELVEIIDFENFKNTGT